MIGLLLAAAAARPDCDRLKGALDQDRCELSDSMNIDPQPNCKNQMTQFDMNVCSFRDYLRADIDLNQTWNAVEERLIQHKKVVATLLAGQRAWLTYRDKQCDVFAQWYDGGSIAALQVNSCLTDITKIRTKELGRLSAQLLEDN